MELDKFVDIVDTVDKIMGRMLRIPCLQCFSPQISNKRFPHNIVNNPQLSALRVRVQAVDSVDKSNAKKIFPDFMHVSGPHSYQQVTHCAIFQKKIFNFIKSRKIGTFMSGLQDGILQEL